MSEGSQISSHTLDKEFEESDSEFLDFFRQEFSHLPDPSDFIYETILHGIKVFEAFYDGDVYTVFTKEGEMMGYAKETGPLPRGTDFGNIQRSETVTYVYDDDEQKLGEFNLEETIKELGLVDTPETAWYEGNGEEKHRTFVLDKMIRMMGQGVKATPMPGQQPKVSSYSN